LEAFKATFKGAVLGMVQGDKFLSTAAGGFLEA